jgi:hypothetical protein
MVPNPSTPFSSPMDPLTATTKVAKAIMNAPTGNGRLIATILSTYDLPHDEDVPTSVTMSYFEPNGAGGCNEISTGPPAARHRDHANSFKFGGASSEGLSAMKAAPNQLVLSAPLPTLYESTVAFTLTYADPTKNLASRCAVKKTLRVNDTQWLILNLDPQRGGGGEEGGRPPMRTTKSKMSGSVSSLGDQSPTLRLKLRLEGPYRPEISALINVSNAWFAAVDAISDTAAGTLAGIARDFPRDFPAARLLLVPAVPLAALASAALPVACGILVICIPLFLPLVLVALAAAAALAAVGCAAYLSTRAGRTQVQHVAEPAYQTFLTTRTGQRIVYDVGPRPSPQALAEAVLPTDMMGKLIASLLIDAVGTASYLIPIAGEGFDLAWAPVSMTFVGAMYDRVVPGLKYAALAEELLPFTDWIPSATLGWAKEFGPDLVAQGMRTMGGGAEKERQAMVRVR